MDKVLLGDLGDLNLDPNFFTETLPKRRATLKHELFALTAFKVVKFAFQEKPIFNLKSQTVKR